VIALILLAIALALYLFADPVAEAMPEAAPVVSSYVEFVQSARVDLATRITVLSERIAPAQP
jgi:cell shape-determining protein MreC